MPVAPPTRDGHRATRISLACSRSSHPHDEPQPDQGLTTPSAPPAKLCLWIRSRVQRCFGSGSAQKRSSARRLSRSARRCLNRPHRFSTGWESGPWMRLRSEARLADGALAREAGSSPAGASRAAKKSTPGLEAPTARGPVDAAEDGEKHEDDDPGCRVQCRTPFADRYLSRLSITASNPHFHWPDVGLRSPLTPARANVPLTARRPDPLLTTVQRVGPT